MDTDVAATPQAIAETDRLGDEIAELFAHLEAAGAHLLDLIREFDARGGWNAGFRSCAHWLAWRVGMNRGAARERVRVARALGALPRLADALARGELSYSRVRAITRVATPETEERLLVIGKAGTAWHVEQIVRGWRRVDQLAEARETTERHKSRALHVRTAEDVPAETPTLSTAQQQADALALLAETAINHDLDPGAPGDRYQVVVHVDASVLADPEAAGQSLLEGGTHVSAETSRRLACDASRVVMRHDPDGRVVEVGARTRTIPPAIRRALHHRDRGCRFPGCGLPFGQGHHIRAVHEEGYQVERQPDGELRFRRPDGRPLPESRLPRPSPTIPFRRFEHGTRRRGSTCMRGRRARAGWASIST